MSSGHVGHGAGRNPGRPNGFSDRQLELLARMAVEAQGLEASDHDAALGSAAVRTIHGPGRAAPRAGRRLLLGRIAGGVLATAAMVGLAAGVISQWTQGGNPVPGNGTASATFAAGALAPLGSDENTVLLAVFHDEFAGTRCVSWRDYDFDGNRCLGDVSEKELRGLCLRTAGLDSCGPKPRQVMLVALAGPRHSLPKSDLSARQLADCILGGERMCDSAGACYVPAARGCVPKNVSFRIETLGMGG